MQREVIILGAGGTGSDVLEWLVDPDALAPHYRCLGFLDDDHTKWGRELDGTPVLGPLSRAPDWPGARFIDAIGSPSNFWRRPAIVAMVPPDQFETIVHPSARISRRASIGSGAIIYPQVVVSPHVQIGVHVTILANAVINHDAAIGDYSIVASGTTVSGSVSVGPRCFLGAGSHVIERAVVGEGAMVGMGSVVIRDVPAGAVVAGNPARALRRPGDGS